MEFGKAYAVALKDMKEVFSSISIYGPMIAVPIVFAFLLPSISIYVATSASPAIITRIISVQLPGLQQLGTSGAKFIEFFATDVLGPIFLTIPIFTASVIAADSFAGEKERRTSEALLATPIKKSELLTGKILASLIPTLILTVVVFSIYGGITNYLTLKYFSVAFLPNLTWLLMLFLSPFLALAAIGVVVFVSSHVKGIKEAQQVSTLLVMPVIFLPFSFISGVIVLNVQFLLGAIIFLALVDFLIIYIGIAKFEKEMVIS